MQKRILQISASEYNTLNELPESDKVLILAARESSNNAYAPYSRFKVGAALKLDNGEIVTGNNQENADFTDGLCAERVALFYAHATYPGSVVKAIAITAQNPDGLLKDSAKPCGSCRQALIETEVRFKQPIRLILDGADRILVFENAESLLPFAFKPDSLG
ncbi:MAG: cytidine deaminase [Draconibacterium sp.]